VHLTLGILRTSQAFSHALSFFWLDGFAVQAPAQVTQTVRRLPCAFFYEKNHPVFQLPLFFTRCDYFFALSVLAFNN
jgi:hypothetical protein